jgi:DNA-directed RNA polymerase subunit RPC12/RpoP
LGVQWFDAAALPLNKQIASLVTQMRLLLQQPGETTTVLRPPDNAGPTGSSAGGADIYFQCDQCGQHLVTEASAAGQSIRCPHCDHALTIPESGDDPSGKALPTRATDAPTVSEAQLLTPEAVTRIENSLTAIIGPIGPMIVRKAMSRTTSLAELRAELLAAIPNASDREPFLRGCGDLIPTGTMDAPAAPATQPASGALPANPPASALLAPAGVADLKATLATFVGPLAKVLVDRALARAGSVPELLDLLAAELDSPKDQERFRQAVQAGRQPGR